MIVTEAPTCSAGVSIRVPVTTTGSSFFVSWALAGTTASPISSTATANLRTICSAPSLAKGMDAMAPGQVS
jgi:hypothetical protein